MKPIRTFIATVFILLAGLSLHAQNPFDLPPLVGGEQWLLREWDDSQTITLSQPETPNVCYEWTGPDIQSGWHTPTITAKPVDSVNIYTVRRISQCGVDEAQITVRLTDTIAIVEVTPKKCFNNGDSIKRDDFVIITNPPGHENWVYPSTTVARHQSQFTSDSTIIIGRQTVKFELRWNGHTSTNSTEIEVVNDNLTATASISPELHNLVKTIQKVEELTKKAEKAQKLFIKKISLADLCEPDIGSLGFSYTLPHTTYYCCNGEVVKSENWSIPSLSISASGDCQFPIPYASIPYVGGFYIVGILSLYANAGPATLHFRGKCSSGDLPIEFGFDLSGGARFQIVYKEFLSGSARFSVGGKFNFSVAAGNNETGLNWKGFEVPVALVGEIKLFSLFTPKVNVPLGTFRLF